MTQAAVADARANFEKAQEDLKQSQREEAKRQLVEVCAQGRQVKRELDALLKTLRQAEAEESRAETELANTNNAIREQIAAKPDAADFPSEGDLDNWQSALDQLTDLRDKAVGRLRAAQQKDAPARLRAIQLDQALVGLRYQQQNLERKVRGEPIAGGWEGGVYEVR